MHFEMSILQADYIHSDKMSILQPESSRLQVAEPLRLPPGYRFHPTDEELVGFYLTQKVMNGNFIFQAIGEVDFNKCEPWDLPLKAKLGESMFYFFSLRDRKYPTGMRTNRATEAGYWKATGKDRDVTNSQTGRLAGMKKTLVFYTGRAPKGEKTNWIMHEYRLEGESSQSAREQQEWVVCRVFEKKAQSKQSAPETSDMITSYATDYSSERPCSSLPPLQNLEPPSPGSVKPNYMFTGLIPSTDPQNFFGGATIPGQDVLQNLRRTNSIRGGRRDSQFGDSLENLLSGWDMGYPTDWGSWDVANTGVNRN